MKNLNLPRGGAQGEREQDTAVIQKYTTKRKLTNVQQDEEIKRRKTMEHIGKNIKAYAPMDVASLPIDIVFLILDKMLEAIDHARFAVVCKEWQSLAEQYNRERQHWCKVHPPMLCIPTQSHGSNDKTAMLYSLSEGKLYSNIKLPVPERQKTFFSRKSETTCFV
uniref:uncharacterized protein LOC101310837 isoform X2 n=1 Tax=Fragaria vesca subsp. vesca TaxID=101020 RepID=UPI0005C924A4|nr:PREDICTED: uncharacterized protein LOC101310837 isoform X2 [Fragaria vesca subsp. vesca]